VLLPMDIFVPKAPPAPAPAPVPVPKPKAKTKPAATPKSITPTITPPTTTTTPTVLVDSGAMGLTKHGILVSVGFFCFHCCVFSVIRT
jgi:hypothetical protein